MTVRVINIYAVLTFSQLAITSISAQTTDQLIFGNDASEKGHSLTTYFPAPTNPAQVPWEKQVPAPSDPSMTPASETTTAALGQSARRLLPRTPEPDVYGGQMTFSMSVDPLQQNYFTIKLWGSEQNGGNLILNCNGKEIGGRHGTGGLSEDPLYFSGTNWFPNRFIYRTEPLPLSMTYHQSAVTITVRSLGSMFDYAPLFTYVPQYQHLMNSPSPSIYAAYTHAGAILDVTGETEGTPPDLPTPRTLEDDDSALIQVQSNVNERLASLLTKPGSELSQADVYFLAECYDAKTKCGADWIEYPGGKTDADVGHQIVAALDDIVTKFGADPDVATGGWGGALGEMGNATRLSWPLLASSMSAQISYGGSLGAVTRQSAWSTALRASIDAGRTHRQCIANQSLYNATNIYTANRGLLLVDPANALKETEALRYIKEACGILPWLGDDLPGSGPVATSGPAPYGPDWYMCTTKGTSKDGDGFVGSDYGEIGSWVYKLGLWSGDKEILARGITLTRARDNFRFPGLDDKGFLVMQGTDPIGERNNDLPGHYVYLGRGFSDDFLMASQGAAAIGADLVGFFQEGMDDGQMARWFPNDPYLPGEYAAIKAMPPTKIKLPMAIGQPDFAWVDEENMVVAAKHGEERFFANLYWRQPGFINGLAKVFHLTPTIAHLGDVMIDDVRFRSSGQTRITETGIDWFATPPDNPIAAFGGMPALIALRSDLTTIPPKNRDAGRGTGYTFRYGNWLVGINGDYRATYTLSLPAGITSATDLISGKPQSGEIVLPPKSSVVFYLPTADKAPLPARTLYLTALGGNELATVSWNPAGGAASYALLRSMNSGGPYSTVATGITTCSYTDRSVLNGKNYYYVVTSINSAGTSNYSPEASAIPIAPETASLATPWGDTDFAGNGGSAAVLDKTISVTGGPGDIVGSSDNGHFLYQPLAGDAVLTAEVTAQNSSNPTAKAGIMLRSSLDAPAAEAVMAAPGTGRESFFLYREKDGEKVSSRSFATPSLLPYWVRLVRSGDAVSGYVSPDGKAWTLAGNCQLTALPRMIYAGLVACPGSYAPKQSNTAAFSSVIMPLSASTPPSEPSTLTAVGGNTNATLNWSGDKCAEVFNVKRSTSASGPFTTIATSVGAMGYTDYGLQNGTTYYYTVSSVNGAGESSDSHIVSVQSTQLPLAVSDLAVTATHAQATLSWTSQPGAISYIVRRAIGPTGIYTKDISGISNSSYVDADLKDGTLYYYQVSAVNGGGEGPRTTIGVLPPGSVPAPWQSIDLGQAEAGGTSFTDDEFKVMGGGSDIWNKSDSFRFVYQTVKGDCKVTARVNGLEKTNDWAKVGVMIRDSLHPDSAFAATFLTPHGGLSSQYRSAAGLDTAVQMTDSKPLAPYGVRVSRQGSSFSFYGSDDGANWTALGQTSIPMGDTTCVGIVVCSHDPAHLNTATLDHVSILLEPPTP